MNISNPRRKSPWMVCLLAASWLPRTALDAQAEAEWQAIATDPKPSSWHVAREGASHDWIEIGSVALDPGDSKLFVFDDGDGVLTNGRRGRTANFFTNLLHGDCELHIEFCVPKGSNSGVYFMSHYEIQVLDSYGKPAEKLRYEDCGGIYQRYDEAAGRGYEGHPPPVNASKAPGEWQSFDISFRAPRFDASGKKTANAKFVKVVHNGVTLHENVEVTGPTRAAAGGPEKAMGPLMIQGDHGPVAYRNIRIRLLD